MTRISRLLQKLETRTIAYSNNKTSVVYIRNIMRGRPLCDFSDVHANFLMVLPTKNLFLYLLHFFVLSPISHSTCPSFSRSREIRATTSLSKNGPVSNKSNSSDERLKFPIWNVYAHGLKFSP